MSQQYKVLVVDDDLKLRSLLERYLTEQGFVVRGVANGEQADRLLTRENFSLMVLDLMLPGEDGLSICRRLREALGDAGPAIARGIPAGFAAVAFGVAPGDHEAAVGKTGDGRVDLTADGLGIDPELGTDRAPGGVVTLGVNSVDRTVLASGNPGQDIGTSNEPGSLRAVLVVSRVVINALFTVNRSHFCPLTVLWPQATARKPYSGRLQQLPYL